VGYLTVSFVIRDGALNFIFIFRLQTIYISKKVLQFIYTYFIFAEKFKQNRFFRIAMADWKLRPKVAGSIPN